MDLIVLTLRVAETRFRRPGADVGSEQLDGNTPP